MLVDKLEEKMKGTSVEGTMAHLFRGTYTSYVKCVNVDFISARDEEFYDLQMPVKGCKDLHASFDEYVKEELLDGENQYESEQYGKQDAKKGVHFKKLPPVLELHLRRFEYDINTDAMAKVNERFEFPTTLDMDREGGGYFSQEADPAVRNQYRLQSVLVHSGGPNGGHYYAFIRPLTSEQWYRFDDERVTKVAPDLERPPIFGETPPYLERPPHTWRDTPYLERRPPLKRRPPLRRPHWRPSCVCPPLLLTGLAHLKPQKRRARLKCHRLTRHTHVPPSPQVKEKEAVEGQFGGTDVQGLPGHTPQWKMPKISNAYMLVYVRESAIPEINVDASGEDIAEHLRRTLEKEHEEKARKKQERLEAHLYTVARVALPTDLAAEIGVERFFDLVSHDKVASLRIKKEHTLLHLKQELWRLTGALPSQQRLWLWAKRQNHTYRPDR